MIYGRTLTETSSKGGQKTPRIRQDLVLQPLFHSTLLDLSGSVQVNWSPARERFTGCPGIWTHGHKNKASPLSSHLVHEIKVWRREGPCVRRKFRCWGGALCGYIRSVEKWVSEQIGIWAPETFSSLFTELKKICGLKSALGTRDYWMKKI